MTEIVVGLLMFLNGTMIEFTNIDGSIAIKKLILDK